MVEGVLAIGLIGLALAFALLADWIHYTHKGGRFND